MGEGGGGVNASHERLYQHAAHKQRTAEVKRKEKPMGCTFSPTLKSGTRRSTSLGPGGVAGRARSGSAVARELYEGARVQAEKQEALRARCVGGGGGGGGLIGRERSYSPRPNTHPARVYRGRGDWLHYLNAIAFFS